MLYVHANWTYEDFFEGLRPSDTGNFSFSPRDGSFLDWVSRELRGQPVDARHILILDQLNRCDTAAVLGELLQLLEYRGETVPLMSGRPFAFPRNLYVIGTMNSADWSVGRLDLALRRRFFWIDLHPQPDTLQLWLAKAGNNPIKFDAKSLSACNMLLKQRLNSVRTADRPCAVHGSGRRWGRWRQRGLAIDRAAFAASGEIQCFALRSGTADDEHGIGGRESSE